MPLNSPETAPAIVDSIPLPAELFVLADFVFFAAAEPFDLDRGAGDFEALADAVDFLAVAADPEDLDAFPLAEAVFVLAEVELFPLELFVVADDLFAVEVLEPFELEVRVFEAPVVLAVAM